MDRVKFLRRIAKKTAEQTGLKISQVETVIRQYYDTVSSMVDKMDLYNISVEDYKKLKTRQFYVPGLGKFIANWKIIEAWRKKYIYDKDKGS